MKLLIITLVLFSTSAFADCVCEARQYNDLFIRRDLSSVDECKTYISDKVYDQYKQGRNCILEDEAVVEWSCSGHFESKSFSCDSLKELAFTEKSLVSLKTFNGTINSEELCEEDEVSQPSPKLGIHFDDKKELERKLKSFNISVSDIFDNPKTQSVTLTISNDNLIGTMGRKGTSNDLGNTHGLNLNITKSIKDGSYMMVMDYDSSLYTQYTNPLHPEYSKKNGVTQVPQNFIEENITRLVLEKAKKGDAFFWQAGLGIQELNKNNSKGDFLFSAAAQQLAFHDLFIKLQQGDDKNKKVITKRYINVPQDGSTTKYFVEGKVGKRLTLSPKKYENFRAYIEASLGGRKTGVAGASYLTSDASLKSDMKLAKNTAIRLSGGKSLKAYDDSQKVSEKYLEVTLAHKKYQQGFRIVDPDQKQLADYQNPMPVHNSDREALAPKRNRSFQYFFKVLW